VTGGLVSGQVIDTTKKINTWKLTHNFTRFEETPLDTNMHQLQRDYNPVYQQGFSYEYLGNLGRAINHVDFFLRPEPDRFLFGRSWDPYLKRPDRTTFFNTKTPFTSIAYSSLPVVDWREENLDALHTQNITPFTNFGIEFNILAGKPLYENEETRVNRVGLFASHAKDRYSIFGTLYYNDFKMGENGGLEDLQSFLASEEEKLWLYGVHLTQAKSHYRNLSLFLTQKYNLLERKVVTDSLGNKSSSGKTLSVSYQLLLDRQMRDYYDEVDPGNLSPVYGNYYYYTDVTKDSASEDKLSNVFQVILGDPDYDRISARISAGYDVRRFGMLSPFDYQVYSHMDTISTLPVVLDSVYKDTAVARFGSEFYHDVYLGFNLAGPTTGVWDWVVDGTYFLAGYRQNEFEVNATFSREVRSARLGISGSLELKKPNYFSNHYSSSFFRWENDFPSLFMIKGEAFLRGNEPEMDIRAGAAYMSNYIYWDQESLPRLYEKDLLVLSAYFSRHFKVSGFNSDNRVLIQYTTASEVLKLPLVAVYTSNYWKQSMFKGALIGDLGIDFYYTTKYKASAYMPATGLFHLQDEYNVGGFPFLDAFLAIRIKRTRIYVSLNNVLQGFRFVGENFFTAYNYPMKPRNFRAGLVWTFYD
jgi:hypothetical protein